MKRPPPFAVALVLASLLIASRWARADVVVLTDGTRLEGALHRTADGYDVIAANGKVSRLKAAQIKSIERKAQPAANEAHRRLDLLRRAADNLTDIKLVLSRYGDYLRQYGNTPQADAARKDV